MTLYPAPYGLPIIETTSKIASALAGQNLRENINELSTLTQVALATEAAKQFVKPTPLTETSDLGTLPSGLYQATNIVVARALGLPRERPGDILIAVVSASRNLIYKSLEEAGSPPLTFVTSFVSGVWAPWDQLNKVDAGPVRREVLRQKLTARKGGKIGTNGKGVVALRFDDGPAEFVSKVLPLLVARGLPFTRVSTSESISGVPIDPAVFPAMQTYCIQNGGELWNHGKDHLNATGETAIHANLIGALETLRTVMPRIPIDCFAPPGGSGMSYDGHMPSAAVTNWADTYAGRLIMAHHALASGYFTDSYYKPIDGTLRDGQIHYSVDAYTLANAKVLVDRARDWKVGVVLMWHPDNLDGAGKMTAADLALLLDYIAAQRDADNVVVLTKSGLGVADLSSSHRDDILTAATGSPYSATVLYPQFRQNIPGSTRELVATVTGAAAATVTSVIGESTKTHTIPAGGTLKLRHCATIPLDATALTVSIDANTTAAKLLAV